MDRILVSVIVVKGKMEAVPNIIVALENALLIVLKSSKLEILIVYQFFVNEKNNHSIFISFLVIYFG